MPEGRPRRPGDFRVAPRPFTDLLNPFKGLQRFFKRPSRDLSLVAAEKSAGHMLVQRPSEDGDTFLLHRLRVHKSHLMAAHFRLKVRFCTNCGCYGQPNGKSVGLQRPCSAPTKTGRIALSSTLRGK